jgi:hypothetical protein
MLRHVTGISAFYSYSRLDSIGALEAALKDAKPDLVIPCDDRVVWQLHEIYERNPLLRPLIEFSMGAASAYEIVSSRERLLDLAKSLSIRIPETRRVTSEDDISAWFASTASSAVLKLDGTWGGEGVEIVHSEQQAIDAFRKLAQTQNFGMALKRSLVNRDPLAFWGWRRRTAPVITIQQFIAGRPANAMLACWNGELLGMLSVEVLSSQGVTGAANIVSFIDHAEIAQSARLLTRRLGLTGFYGLDFMLETATGCAWLIEMNPRCTQLGHLARTGQMDLAGLLYARLTGQVIAPPQVPIEEKTVAFFPQAIDWNPRSHFLHSGYHDVPWEEPRLVKELLKKPWPERQWIARVYHHFRAPKKVAVAEFETVGAVSSANK